MTLTVGSLFAGIGGIDLGLERAGMKTVWQVEIDPWCQKVLAKHWPDVERFADVKEVGAHNLKPVDVICGGFPCQDLSYAGRGAGIITGTRSGLWFEYARIIRELRPRYVLVENVPALLRRGLHIVLGDLAALGYDAEWDCISASAVGAPHRRDRVWLLAYPNGERQAERGERALASGKGSGRLYGGGGGGGVAWQESVRGSGEGQGVAHANRQRELQPQGFLADQRGRLGDGGETLADAAAHGRQPRWPSDATEVSRGRESDRGGVGVDVEDADGCAVESRGRRWRAPEASELADSDAAGLEGRHIDRISPREWIARARSRALKGIWRAEPGVGRVAHGIPARVDRLAGLGNAVVPQIPEEIGRQIIAWEEANANY